MLEFAMVIIALVIVMLGIMDFGRLYFTYASVANAAREGARYGAIFHCDETGIEATAQRYAVGLGDGVEVTIQRAQGGDPLTLERIIVTVTYDFKIITPLVGVFLGGDQTIPLSSQSRQHIESPTDC